MGVAAEIIQVRGKLGVKGVSRVRAKVLEGPDKNKVIVRNVVGPLRVGDIIVLKETGIDAEGRFSR